ncbi:MAG: tetratricopeptide repeat protein, partial [Deltaproteobacteria bacterium]|nr:tetratricopeptide repeat protein [Deltaproteobacteria bacterium]
LLKIGDLHLKLDSHENAIKTYEQVGEFYYREGFSVKAIAVYKQIRGIIRRHAQHLEGRYGHIVPRLAEIYTQLGLTSDALAAYDEVASRLRQEGRERDALDIFKKVVELDPQNPIAHLRVADSRARLGEIDKAVERFGEAARIMLRLGRKDDSLKVLERLLEFRPDAEYARLAGKLYLERNEANDGMAALSKLQIAFKSDPKDLETLSALAAAFDAINQPKKAIEVLKESARIAKEHDREAFGGLLETLLERAPDDTAVRQLNSWRVAQDADDGDVEVEVLSEQDVGLDGPIDSIDEVFELDDADVQAISAAYDESDLFATGDGDESSAVRRLLSESERHRVAGQMDHAIELLRDGLSNLGSSAQLRQKLSDLLLEAGDQGGCITEKLILAQELANGGQVEPALEMLDEVLLLHPGQPDAVQMRTNLGFPPMDDGQAAEIDGLQLDAPLQSYDVESGGVEEALTRSRHHSVPLMPAVSLDDPFAGGSTPGAAPNIEQVAGPDLGGAPPLAERLPAAVPQTLDEDALDQAEDMADAGRFDEARALLQGQLQILPNHPLVLERLSDIDALVAHGAAGSVSGPYPVPPQPDPASLAVIPEAAPSYEQSPYNQVDYDQRSSGYDLPSASHDQSSASYDQSSASYDQSSASYVQPSSEQAPYSQAPQDEASYDQSSYSQQGYQPVSQQPAQADVVADLGVAPVQARPGMHAVVDDADAATHYDLGVAYLEMGLHSDAISELTLAARDASRSCVCLSTIGTIHLQLNDLDQALDALHRALNADEKTREQELALGYEIANTYEMKLMAEQSLKYFEWLAKFDPHYSDPRGTVTQRIERLRVESGAQLRPQAPNVTPDDGELDDALDDLFGDGSK